MDTIPKDILFYLFENDILFDGFYKWYRLMIKREATREVDDLANSARIRTSNYVIENFVSLVFNDLLHWKLKALYNLKQKNL